MNIMKIGANNSIDKTNKKYVKNTFSIKFGNVADLYKQPAIELDSKIKSFPLYKQLISYAKKNDVEGILGLLCKKVNLNSDNTFTISNFDDWICEFQTTLSRLGINEETLLKNIKNITGSLRIINSDVKVLDKLKKVVNKVYFSGSKGKKLSLPNLKQSGEIEIDQLSNLDNYETCTGRLTTYGEYEGVLKSLKSINDLYIPNLDTKDTEQKNLARMFPQLREVERLSVIKTSGLKFPNLKSVQRFVYIKDYDKNMFPKDISVGEYDRRAFVIRMGSHC